MMHSIKFSPDLQSLQSNQDKIIYHVGHSQLSPSQHFFATTQKEIFGVGALTTGTYNWNIHSHQAHLYSLWKYSVQQLDMDEKFNNIFQTFHSTLLPLEPRIEASSHYKQTPQFVLLQKHSGTIPPPAYKSTHSLSKEKCLLVKENTTVIYFK